MVKFRYAFDKTKPWANLRLEPASLLLPS